MPEQQPDKRCETCDRWAIYGLCGICLAPIPWWIAATTNIVKTQPYEGDDCDAWTPKSPKNPEEK
jgi:hypothetical protein